MHWVLEHFPWAPYWLPARKRVPFTRGYLGPSGAWWLRDRFEGKVPSDRGARCVSARAEGDGVGCASGSRRAEKEIRAHAVIAGTGFEVDVDRLPFLDRRLARADHAHRARAQIGPALPVVGARARTSPG